MKRLVLVFWILLITLILVACDSEAPSLDCYVNYNIYVGDETPLISDICTITDNSDDILDITSTGYVNTDSSGTYSVTITAGDSSGNSDSKRVNIIVNRLLIATLSISNYDYYLGISYDLHTDYNNTSYTSISFDFNEFYGYEYDFTMWVRVEYETYNSYFDNSTKTNLYGIEVTVRPLDRWLVNDSTKCIVINKISDQGNSSLSKEEAVLSGHGTAKTFIDDVSIGISVITEEITDGVLLIGGNFSQEKHIRISWNAVVIPPHSSYFATTAIFRGFASSALGTDRVSTPSSMLASIAPPFTGTGNLTVLTTSPYPSSPTIHL